MTKWILILALVLSGCTRIETGHVGVRTAWNGQVELNELDVGWHQTMVGHITNYVANEITLEVLDLHPQTKDRSVLSDLDLTFTYTIAKGSIADLVTRYKGRDLSTDHGIYPVGRYVGNVVQTAAADVVAKYDALEANEKRETIRTQIAARTKILLNEEKLGDIISIHQVFIKSLQIDPAIQASARAVITAQNDLSTKTKEVETAKKEADKMEALAKTGDAKYVALVNAQANMKIAEAVAAGKVQTIIIPSTLTMLGGIK